ncbi:MAG: FHA domain-containing protein [Chloroflexi bacterium]|nr:MAG: FHA domain-containing protein [Chloroflexota bacterium]
MEWNTILFAARWAFIGLFYFVLLLLLFGVYREMSGRTNRDQMVTSGQGGLRVLQSGSDKTVKAGKIIPLKNENRIGADSGNDIVLGDKYVSGYHASLKWDGSGWWLEDLNSKNGTKVNQMVCQPRRPQAVRTGSRISMGDMIFELLD